MNVYRVDNAFFPINSGRIKDATVGSWQSDVIFIGKTLRSIQITRLLDMGDDRYYIETHLIFSRAPQSDALWEQLSTMIENKSPIEDIINYMEFVSL